MIPDAEKVNKEEEEAIQGLLKQIKERWGNVSLDVTITKPPPEE